MPEPQRASRALPDILEFRPQWWWDPLPPWIFEQLQPAIVKELAIIKMEFEHQVLQAQLKAVEQSLALIRRAQ